MRRAGRMEMGNGKVYKLLELADIMLKPEDWETVTEFERAEYARYQRETRSKIQALKAKGYSPQEIQRETGLESMSVKKYY